MSSSVSGNIRPSGEEKYCFACNETKTLQPKSWHPDQLDHNSARCEMCYRKFREKVREFKPGENVCAICEKKSPTILPYLHNSTVPGSEESSRRKCHNCYRKEVYNRKKMQSYLKRWGLPTNPNWKKTRAANFCKGDIFSSTH